MNNLNKKKNVVNKKQLIFLIFLIILFVYLFDSYNPFGIKIFDNTKPAYVKEEPVVNKEKIKKSNIKITPQTYFLRGKENLKNNNIKQAISNFSKAINLDPNYYEAYKERALAKDKLGDLSGAQKDFEQYMILLEEFNKEKNEKVYYEMTQSIKEGYALLYGKKYDDALYYFTNLINSYSYYPDVYLARGDTYFVMSKYEQALNDYKKAMSLGNKTFITYLKLANTKYELAKYKDCIEDYLYVLKLDPDYEYAHYKLIGAYIFIEDFNSALKSLNNYINSSSSKQVQVSDYSKWTGILNKYTENETIRDIKNNLKNLKFVKR